jgi:hypothetical protein
VRSDPRPLADVQRQAEWLSGSRIDPTAGSVPLDLAAARDDRQPLRAQYPAEFTVSPAQVLAWHEREAVDAERANEWAAALPHLGALLAVEPAASALQARRAAACAALGRWGPAAAGFDQASTREPGNLQIRCSQALAHLGRGDGSGYRRCCAALLQRSGRSVNPSDAGTVARTCLLDRGAAAHAALLVALAQQAVASDARNAGFLTTLGGALYRAGRFKEVIARMTQESAPTVEGDDAVRSLFVAMAHARLGHPAEARRWLKEATVWTEPALQRKPWEEPLPWDQRLLLQRLHLEAAALIHPPPPMTASGGQTAGPRPTLGASDGTTTRFHRRAHVLGSVNMRHPLVARHQPHRRARSNPGERMG